MGIDRRERNGDPNAAMSAMLEGWQSGLWTALPGIIQSFNADKKTCVVLPALQASVMKADGSFVWATLPLLLDCPVQFPGGGGMTLTFPLVAGDECLVIFASRCIDAWWQSGCPLDSDGRPTTQVQAEFRMHDLSDGFVIAGISSLPSVPASISTTACELRDVAGEVRVRVNPTTKDVDVETTAGITLSGATVNINGVLTINGTAYLAHTHSGVLAGGAHTGGVP